ncbi:hemerythrin domain-containing protein [Streptomyces sp. NPDC059070]|uniref:hemerythrin domain-containing protein n=1 Tax=unclassified Streptomyces TaxID=2593676 RepID=UPI0034E22008
MTAATENPGARMYQEFLGVHAILRRGTELVADAFARLGDGDRVSVKELIDTAQWLIDFTHHHHESEDELFWPVLHGLYPESVSAFDTLNEEHAELDRELGGLSRAVELLTAAGEAGEPVGSAAVTGAAHAGTEAARKVRDILASHLDTEEPVVRDLFPGVPGPEIDRLRTAITEGSPKSGGHLVFGLLEDPELAEGYDELMDSFPLAFRSNRPALIQMYVETKKALGLLAA